MGRGYVIEHCVSTFNHMQEEDAFKTYASEILRSISKSLGVDVTMSFHDYLESMKPQKEETRTAEEVVSGIKAKAQKLRGDVQ